MTDEKRAADDLKQKDRRWTVRADACPMGNGADTKVKIYAMNGLREVIPLVSFVSWYPGAEAADIEAAGLGLAAARLESLVEALRLAGREKLTTGQ